MSLTAIRPLLARELRALRREVEAYPDDASLWHVPPGTSNAGGTLVLHLVGNLQHFVGAVLGGTGYLRERDREFSESGLPRSELVERIERTMAVVDETLRDLPPEESAAEYPAQVAGRTVRTDVFLMHLLSHLAYHLGQVDYHRRITTGQGGALDTVAVSDLPDARD